jgi:hypothetical protein
VRGELGGDQPVSGGVGRRAVQDQEGQKLRHHLQLHPRLVPKNIFFCKLIFFFFSGVAKDKLDVKVFWASAAGDLPFAGIDSDACAVTSCPVAAQQAQNLTYALNVPKKTASVSLFKFFKLMFIEFTGI